MAYNYNGYNDIGNTLITSLYNTVTGSNATTSNWDASEFVDVAQKTLATGYDSVLGAISTVLNNTLFDVSTYDAPLKILEMPASQFGNLTRILKFYDNVATEKDPSVDFTNVVTQGGLVPDQWDFNMPETMQLNLQGSVTYAKHQSFGFRGLEYAFQNASELGQFWASTMIASQNRIESSKEALRRATLLNYIAGVWASANLSSAIAPERKVNLLKEYNTATNSSLTMATVMAPANFPDFCKFAIAKMKEYSTSLAEPTKLYQTNVPSPTGANYIQALPKSRQRMILYAPLFEQFSTRVKSDIFNKELVGLDGYEFIDYWQNPVMGKKTDIDVKATYLKTDGTVAQATLSKKDATKCMLVGCIFDRNAVATATTFNEVRNTGVNAATLHYNLWYHWTDKYINRFDLKSVIFIMADEGQD